MKELKLYKLLTVVLIIVNIGTITFFLLKPGGPPNHPPLAKVLEVSGEREEKLKSIEQKHHEEKKKLISEKTTLYKKMYGNVMSSREINKEIYSDISLKQFEIDSMTFRFFHDVSELCNESQKKRLMEMLKDAIPGQPRKRKH